MQSNKGLLSQPVGVKSARLSKFESPAESPDQRSSQRALEMEIQSYCTLAQLTPRESDVLKAMAEGAVRIQEIAQLLKLSPNTVNNHVNSIFNKTKTRSKSEILSTLLMRLAGNLRKARLYSRKPRLLIISDDGNFQESLFTFFNQQEFRVKSGSFPRSSQALKQLDSYEDFVPDFVIVDLEDDAPSEQDFLAWASDRFSASVLFCSRRCDEMQKCIAMDLGAIDLISKSIEPSTIHETLIKHYVEEDEDRASIPTVETEKLILSRDIIGANYANMGIGGIFLNSHDLNRLFVKAPTVGDWVELKLSWDIHQEPPIGSAKITSVIGEVVWKRDEDCSPGFIKGAGVRLLTYGDAETRNLLISGLRKRGVRTYIPAGAM